MPDFYSDKAQDHINAIEPSSAGQLVAVPFELVIPSGETIANDDNLYLVKIPPGCELHSVEQFVVDDIDAGATLRVNMGFFNADGSENDEDAFADGINVSGTGRVTSAPDRNIFLGIVPDAEMFFGWRASAAGTGALTSDGTVKGIVFYATAHP